VIILVAFYESEAFLARACAKVAPTIPRNLMGFLPASLFNITSASRDKRSKLLGLFGT
jgi:hypothetical protein